MTWLENEKWLVYATEHQWDLPQMTLINTETEQQFQVLDKFGRHYLFVGAWDIVISPNGNLATVGLGRGGDGVSGSIGLHILSLRSPKSFELYRTYSEAKQPAVWVPDSAAVAFVESSLASTNLIVVAADGSVMLKKPYPNSDFLKWTDCQPFVGK